MLKTSILLLLALLFSGPHRPPAQQVIIDSPRQGEALQGQVAIKGTTDMEGLQSYQVDFAYQRDQTNTWFPVARGDEVLAGKPWRPGIPRRSATGFTACGFAPS